MNLEETIINIISETLGVEKNKISTNSNFFEDLNADKLEVVDLILKIQQACKVDIVEENFNKIQTVADLINLIEENSDEL